MHVTTSQLSLSESEVAHAAVLDIRFDGRRIWSLPTPDVHDGSVNIEWPAALQERLVGATTLSVTESATGRVLVSEDVVFGDPSVTERISLTDKRGRPVAVNKWGNFGAVNEGRDESIRHRMLVAGREVVDVLEAAGWQPYVVGGALLGVVRDGQMLPHDDDLDLSFLSAFSDPADLVQETYRMQRVLEQAGYTVYRHSLAHITMHFLDENGFPEFYVDVFTGFIRDGIFNQPFPLRGRGVTADALVPVQQMSFEGVLLPAPRDPIPWLELTYGPGWRVPDPGFVFEDVPSTGLRFDGWFSAYNQGHDAEDAYYLEHEQPIGFGDGEAEVARFVERIPAGARILDLGCGDGRWSQLLAQSGHRVTAVDFSYEALGLARANNDAGVDYRLLNVNDPVALTTFAAWMLGTGDEWVVFAHHFMQTLITPTRRQVYGFFAAVLRGQGFAWIVNDTEPATAFDPDKPNTWHMPPEWMLDEALHYPLVIERVDQGTRIEDGAERPTATYRVLRRDQAAAQGAASTFVEPLNVSDLREDS